MAKLLDLRARFLLLEEESEEVYEDIPEFGWAKPGVGYFRDSDFSIIGKAWSGRPFIERDDMLDSITYAAYVREVVPIPGFCVHIFDFKTQICDLCGIKMCTYDLTEDRF